MRQSEFAFIFFRKGKRDCITLNLRFVFFRKKGKRNARVSEFFCHGKEKGNKPREFDFSFPGRSKYDEIS